MSAAPTRPALRYHGGKWRLAPWIIEHFPAHRVYTEAFGGAASVLMRKPRASMVEVYNDMDGQIVNLFAVLRDPQQSAALASLLALTPYARAEFELSYEPSDDPVEQARRTVVRAFQGFGSDSASGAKTGFRANGNRQSMHPANDWTNYAPQVQAYHARMQGVVVENREALRIIQQHDHPLTLHYCDPPYVHASRSGAVVRAGKGYRHEMTDADHQQLAALLHSCVGMVALSGYDSELYQALYGDWQRFERDTKADGGLERTEVLWLNPACVAALARQQPQASLGLEAIAA